jgi:hypothetical protein
VHRLILLIALFVTAVSFAQIGTADLFAPINESFQDRIGRKSTTFRYDFHSSIRPYRLTDVVETDGGLEEGIDKKPFYSNFNSFDSLSKKYGVMVYPVVDVSTGYELESKSRALYGLQGGVGIKGNLSKIFTYDVRYSYNFEQGLASEDSLFTTSGNQLGIYSTKARQFHNVDVRLNISPVKEFSAQIGYGKNFIGEGYRSLFLSDHASAYPFLKLQTRVWKLEYTNLFAWHKEPISNMPNGEMRNKFTSSHYVSYNAFKGFNLSVFETVIWQAKDTLFNRGYDITYLNPIIFFRPLEYAQGSSDNVIIGAAMSYKFKDKYMLYAQFVLDEFLLKEIKAGNKWWANKFGIQTGFKTYDIAGVKGLGFRTEFNWVRPFTYAHKSNGQSYSNKLQPLAHPMGANFMELTNRISYSHKRWQASLDINYNAKGYDNSDTLTYGGEVNLSYQLRDGEYGHEMLQGEKINKLIINGSVSYILFPRINMNAFFDVGVHSQFYNGATTSNFFFSTGIRTGLWNRDRSF